MNPPKPGLWTLELEQEDVAQAVAEFVQRAYPGATIASISLGGPRNGWEEDDLRAGRCPPVRATVLFFPAEVARG